MICRDGWGALPAREGGISHIPRLMTIHHTGAVLGDNRNAPARLRQHQQLHQNQHGWTDIAYHVAVDRNGNIYELRDPMIKGDTATEYDTDGHFLVLCEGNFDEEEVIPEQLGSAAIVFAWAANEYAISPTVVEGHRNYAATACPGANLYAYVESGELTRRVNELLASGPIELQRICGTAALERVAAIQAGD
ncbi:N-acetylmuramoyl-L-alanine amidase [Mycolicibacterium gilvum]|uniref:N-acetylmuramoyl-L-alanine amidase n=2 Tax=Mycolicibacterium gilvum TaxID=1804 RepID=A0A378SY86_9MYCO|nr:N-acetylmuramoyl-L-alanine amidase [Mycolicibacterium gilvum]